MLQNPSICNRVQDAYTLRCCPQVHGIVHDTINFVRGILTDELNSATDNPIILSDRGEIISAGNFHGEYPAKVLDYLSIAIHEMASMSERRIERLVNPAYSELPAFLVKEGGMNSGFMLAHCTAASLGCRKRGTSYRHRASRGLSSDRIPSTSQDYSSSRRSYKNAVTELLKEGKIWHAVKYHIDRYNLEQVIETRVFSPTMFRSEGELPYPQAKKSKRSSNSENQDGAISAPLDPPKRLRKTSRTTMY
ncbi:Histidine ammonia-lyase [Armadillidium vulgare]|nr:Histidine ammonia-lyase [Armadillidium vulgare]